MVKRSVFIEKQVGCLVCKRQIPLRYPNPRYYVAATRESDQHVIAYRWAEGLQAGEQVPPHYYAVWQCPHCLFADFTESFNRPTGGLKEDHLRAAYLKSAQETRTVLVELRKLVPEGDIDFDGAVALHLAAIKIATLPDKEEIDHNKLGRLSLRLGWLFRERSEGQVEAEESKGALAELQDGVESLGGLMASLSEVLGDVRRCADGRAKELGLMGEGEENPYASISASLGDKLDEMRTLLSMMQSAVLHDRKGELSTVKDLGGGKPTGLDELLMSLRSYWAELPRSEEECLRMAVDALDYSYGHESSLKSIEQGMSVVSLIINLLARIDDHQGALRHVSEVYKSGMNSINDLRWRIREGKKKKILSPHDERMLNRKIGNISVAIRQAGESRRNLLDLLCERHSAAIGETLAQTEGKPLTERMKALKDAGVPEEVISDLRARKVIKDKKKKGGLFG